MYCLLLDSFVTGQRLDRLLAAAAVAKDLSNQQPRALASKGRHRSEDNHLVRRPEDGHHHKN